jgi:hypothetical protein
MAAVSLSAPPGLECFAEIGRLQEAAVRHLRFARGGAWTSSFALYAQLEWPHDDAPPRLFLTPSDLAALLIADPRVEAQLQPEGTWTFRSRMSKGRSTQLQRALAGVLRYEVDSFVRLDSLTHLVARRLRRDCTEDEVYAELYADPARFETTRWTDDYYWARALYRH